MKDLLIVWRVILLQLYCDFSMERPFEEIVILSSHQEDIHRHTCALPITIAISIYPQVHPVPSKVSIEWRRVPDISFLLMLFKVIHNDIHWRKWLFQFLDPVFHLFHLVFLLLDLVSLLLDLVSLLLDLVSILLDLVFLLLDLVSLLLDLVRLLLDLVSLLLDLVSLLLDLVSLLLDLAYEEVCDYSEMV